MSSHFQELDYCPTPIGTLTLRRRRDPATGVDLFEIKLGEDFLMSSQFTASEVALADLGLAGMEGGGLHVIVGGLGLGYTARAVLQHKAVRSLVVIEALAPVIEWHEKGLLPLGKELTGDRRCRLVRGDFFAMAAAPDTGFDPVNPGSKFHAILLDIDHSPTQFLHPANAALYEPSGLSVLAKHLRPGGVFALWSNDPPDAAFTERLAGVFETARAEAVTFHNPLQDRDATQAIYLARKAGEAA